MLASICRFASSTVICLGQAFRGFAVNFFTGTKPDWLKSSINNCQDSNIHIFFQAIRIVTLFEQDIKGVMAQ